MEDHALAGGSATPARFRITEQDYVNAMRLYARPTPRLLWITAGIFLAAIAVAVGGRPVASAGAVGGLIGGVLILLGSRFLLPGMARRHYRKYKGMQDEFTAELLEDGLRFTSVHGNGKLVWANILKWRQNDEYVLLYPMPRLFHILPTSVAAQGFDIAALIDRLRTHVGAPR